MSARRAPRQRAGEQPPVGERVVGRQPPVEGVVVAAGASRRMGGVDKLAELVAGKPVLQWSVEVLVAAGARRVVIVTAADRLTAVAGAPWLPPEVVAVVTGGERRQESVAAGVAALAAVSDEGGARGTTDAGETATGVSAREDPVVLVHDAARPAASPELCRRVADAAARHGAAIPVMPATETLKRVEAGLIRETIDREQVVAAQTPQGARRSLLEKAFATYPPEGAATFTDEAALLEACRIPVYAIDGEPGNLKVTLPGDLARAESVLAQRTGGANRDVGPTTIRVGFGTDSHPFGVGEPLALGGLRFPGVPRLSGHSDGDVALHAVADALLGAAALGDLGTHFPADSRTPEGIESRDLLTTVARTVRAAGWRPSSLDLTIVAARPRLGDRLPEMASAIAAILEIPLDAVSVKASTGNLEGAEGGGRSISAHAVAVLERDGER